jgi:hypothetical protein
VLVLASELPGPCAIDSVQLLCGSDTYDHGTFYNAGVWCCHTTATELDSNFEANYTGHSVKGARLPDTLALDWQNGVWGGIGFDDQFDFEGVDNLIVEFRWGGDDNNSVYDLGFYTSGNRAMNADSPTAPAGTPRNYMPRMRIFYTTVGVTEEVPAPTRTHGAVVTTVRGTAPAGVLLNALGRPVTNPAPGVYFLLPSRSGSVSGPLTKVILTR